MIVGIAVSVILLAAGGFGVFYLLSHVNADADGARETAQRFAAATERAAQSNGRGVTAADFESIVCAGDFESLRNDIAGLPMEDHSAKAGFRVTVKEVTVQDDTGTIVLTTETAAPDGAPGSADETLNLVMEDGQWKVCGLPRSGP